MRRFLHLIVAAVCTQGSMGYAQEFNLYDPRATVPSIESAPPTPATHLPDHSPMLPEAMAADYGDAGISNSGDRNVIGFSGDYKTNQIWFTSLSFNWPLGGGVRQ